MKSDSARKLHPNNGRPPHGGRGLKYDLRAVGREKREVAPHTGGVD